MLAVHTTGFVPVHTPDRHLSVRVQVSPSLQLVPSGLLGFEQVPVAGSQVPALWQASLAVHERGLEPTQLPDWQVSVRVQALPSLQLVPFDLAGFEHVPVLVLHVPVL